MNYRDTLIEVADDCPVTRAEVPRNRGGKKTRPVIEYDLIANDPYRYTEQDLAFLTYAVLHDIPKRAWPKERREFLSRGHPHLRVSALPKRYGWGIHNNHAGKTALVALESPMYRKLLNDRQTTKIKAFRSKSA